MYNVNILIDGFCMNAPYYKQLRDKLYDFYFLYVVNVLPKFKYEIITETIMHFLFLLFCVSLLLFFIYILFPAYCTKLILYISYFLCCCSSFFLFLFNFYRRKNSKVIDANIDTKLKKEFLVRFLDIFFQNVECSYSPRAYVSVFKSQEKKDPFFEEYIQKARKKKIFNSMPLIYIGDCITGVYNGVNVKIEEISTSPFRSLTFFILLLSSFAFCMIPFLVFFHISILLYSIAVVIFLFSLLRFIDIFRILYSYFPFTGFVIELEFDKDFVEETFFLERSFSSSRILFDKTKYKEVKLESVTFSNKYRIYSTDQIEARKILSPSLIEKIDNIKFSFKSNFVRGNFKRKKFILSVNTGKDMFVFARYFRKTTFNDFSKYFEEMISILQLIDELRTFLKKK